MVAVSICSSEPRTPSKVPCSPFPSMSNSMPNIRAQVCFSTCSMGRSVPRQVRFVRKQNAWSCAPVAISTPMSRLEHQQRSASGRRSVIPAAVPTRPLHGAGSAGPIPCASLYESEPGYLSTVSLCRKTESASLRRLKALPRTLYWRTD